MQQLNRPDQFGYRPGGVPLAIGPTTNALGRIPMKNLPPSLKANRNASSEIQEFFRNINYIAAADVGRSGRLPTQDRSQIEEFCLMLSLYDANNRHPFALRLSIKAACFHDGFQQAV